MNWPATTTQKQRFSHLVHAPTLTHRLATATATCWTNVACVVAPVPSTIVVATNSPRVIAIATATSWMLWASAVATALQMQTVMACATRRSARAPKMLAACDGPGAIYECGCEDLPAGDCDCNGNQLDALGVCGGTCTADVNGNGVCDDAGDTSCTTAWRATTMPWPGRRWSCDFCSGQQPGTEYTMTIESFPATQLD